MPDFAGETRNPFAALRQRGNGESRTKILVGTGGGLEAAADALQPGDDILHLHADHQLADALKVAVTAALDLKGLDDAVLHLEGHLTGTDALGLIIKEHEKNSFPVQIKSYRNDYIS